MMWPLRSSVVFRRLLPFGLIALVVSTALVFLYQSESFRVFDIVTPPSPPVAADGLDELALDLDLETSTPPTAALSPPEHPTTTAAAPLAAVHTTPLPPSPPEPTPPATPAPVPSAEEPKEPPSLPPLYHTPLVLPVPPPVDERPHPVVDGFLHVHDGLPATSHPIYQLIRDAMARWEAKNARASKTLRQAVAEYRRRYGRPPPKGFDHWWSFVQANAVPLPDEYDQILKDLEPYRGFSPEMLRERMDYLRTLTHLFSVRVKNGTVSMPFQSFDATISGETERAEGQMHSIVDVAQWIPDFEAIFSIDDTPTQFVSYAHLTELKRLAAKGEYFPDNLDADQHVTGWGAACPPETPLYNASLHSSLFADPKDPTKTGPDYFAAPPEPPLKGPKSFLINQNATLNLCDHPEYIHTHGSVSNQWPEPHPALLPIFSLSKTNLHADIMAIPVEQFTDAQGAMNWADKEEKQLHWRGRNTGGWFSKETPWRSSHRARLARMMSDYVEEDVTVELLPPPKVIEKVLKEEGHSRLTLGEVRVGAHQRVLNAKMMDVGLAYEAIQCDEEDGTCDAIREELPYRNVTTFDREGHFRFILDIDGNAWSARFKRLLVSNALVFKSTIFPEWWNDRAEPWVHFIPVKLDYSDLYDMMSFFEGGGDGEDALAQAIAANGRRWSLTHWRRVDVTAYMFRLYLEWARIYAEDRESMDFHLQDDDVHV